MWARNEPDPKPVSLIVVSPLACGSRGKAHKAISSDALGGGFARPAGAPISTQFILLRQFTVRCGHPSIFRIARDNVATWGREAIAHRSNGEPSIRTSFAPETACWLTTPETRQFAAPAIRAHPFEIELAVQTSCRGLAQYPIPTCAVSATSSQVAIRKSATRKHHYFPSLTLRHASWLQARLKNLRLLISIKAGISGQRRSRSRKAALNIVLCFSNNRVIVLFRR
ncbi:hypothetical protein V1283_006056 [Bradyrhizobium sp. AZCC 2262]